MNFEGGTRRVNQLSSSARPFDGAADYVPLGYHGYGDYEVSVPVIAVRMAAGQFKPLRSTQPGALPAPILDDRPDAIVDPLSPDAPRNRHLLNRVRSFAPSLEQRRYAYRIDAITDGGPSFDLFNYEETQTLGFSVCRALEVASRGIRGGDLEPGGPMNGPECPPGRPCLSCPTASAWSRNSGTVINSVLVGCTAPGCNIPDPQLIAAVSRLLSQQQFFESPIEPFVNAPRLAPPLPPVREAICVADGYTNAYQYIEEPVTCVPTPQRACP